MTSDDGAGRGWRRPAGEVVGSVADGVAAILRRAESLLVALFLVWAFHGTVAGLFGLADLPNQPWHVGDWLIHYGAGFTRRGFAGTVLVGLAEATGLLPGDVVVAAVLALYAVSFAGVWAVVRSAPLTTARLLVLVSPAFVAFPARSYNGTARKELLVFALLAVWAAARERHGTATAWVLAIASPAVVLSHEMTFALLPFLAVAVWWCEAPVRTRKAALGVTVVGSVVAFVAAIAGPAPDPWAICDRLLADGHRWNVCSGAILWLGYGTSEGLVAVSRKLADPGFGIAYGIAAVLTIFPVFLLIRASAKVEGTKARVRALVVACVLSAALFVPVAVVAIDWGRFLGAWAFGASVLALVLPIPNGSCSGARTIAALFGAWLFFDTWLLTHMYGLRGWLVGLLWTW